MNAVLYILPVFIALVVIELFASRLMGKPVYKIKDAITSMNIGSISEIVRGLVKLVTFGVYGVLELKVGLINFEKSDPLAWVLAFFLYDFFYYWMHRAGHEINVLWGAHGIHHSSEFFNFSTGMRQSATTVFYNWIFYLPMAVLGIPVSVFIVISFASLFYQFWVHTELIPKMGWFDRVFVSPSNHRVHHGQNSYCIDANYGATLILWDRLFGTFAEEKDEEPVVYGIRKPLKSWNPVWVNLELFKRLITTTLNTQGWKNKLMRFFGPPGWEPEQNAVQKTAFSAEKFTRHDTSITKAQSVYALLSYMSVTLLFVHFLTVTYSLAVPARIQYGSLIALHALCIGSVLENKNWGTAIDLLRGVLIFSCIIGGVWFSPVNTIGQFLAIIGLLALLGSHALLFAERSQTDQLSRSETI